jgi:hypothetical protein
MHPIMMLLRSSKPIYRPGYRAKHLSSLMSSKDGPSGIKACYRMFLVM